MKNIPATIQNNNEEEEEEDDDDDNNDNNDNDDNDDDSPRQLLPNHTHNDLDVPSRKKHTLEMALMRRWQLCKQMKIW